MSLAPQVVIRPFQVADQDAAKQLILAGLGERWGWIDPTLNPDLNNIAASYASGVFLVGYLGDTLVATGALSPETTDDGLSALRVERMSVRADLRGQGLGQRMLGALIDLARERGCCLVVLETTTTWTDAVRFYLRYGFQYVEERDGDTHMKLEVENVG